MKWLGLNEYIPRAERIAWVAVQAGFLMQPAYPHRVGTHDH